MLSKCWWVSDVCLSALGRTSFSSVDKEKIYQNKVSDNAGACSYGKYLHICGRLLLSLFFSQQISYK